MPVVFQCMIFVADGASHVSGYDPWLMVPVVFQGMIRVVDHAVRVGRVSGYGLCG